MAVSRMPAPPVKKKAKKVTKFLEFQHYEDGRIRHLKFDVNALADFEQETGMGFAQLMRQRAIFGSARAMIWAGLKHEDRALTIQGVGDLLQEYLTDDGVPQGEHSIDSILGVVIEAAIEQGALGRRVEPEPEVTDEGEVIDAEKSLPNGPASDENTLTPTTQE